MLTFADRAKTVDGKGKVVEYTRGGGFSLFQVGQNSFSQEKRAVEHVRAILQGESIVTEEDTAVLGFKNPITATADL